MHGAVSCLACSSPRNSSDVVLNTRGRQRIERSYGRANICTDDISLSLATLLAKSNTSSLLDMHDQINIYTLSKTNHEYQGRFSSGSGGLLMQSHGVEWKTLSSSIGLLPSDGMLVQQIAGLSDPWEQRRPASGYALSGLGRALHLVTRHGISAQFPALARHGEEPLHNAL